MIEQIRTGKFDQNGGVYRDKEPLLSPDTAPFVTAGLENGLLERPVTPIDVDDNITHRSRSIIFSNASIMGHVTLSDYIPSIEAVDTLVTRAKSETEWYPNLSRGPLSVFFPREKQVQLLLQGKPKLPLLQPEENGHTRPNFTLMVFRPSVLNDVMRHTGYGKDEFVAKRGFAATAQNIDQYKEFSFLNPEELHTAIPVKEHLLAKVPVTPQLQEGMMDITTCLVFGDSFRDIAIKINLLFDELNSEHDVEFPNEGLASDDIFKLSTLWTESLMKDYWDTYSIAVERMIQDKNNEWSIAQKTAIFRKLFLQLGPGFLRNDWDSRYRDLYEKGLLEKRSFNEEYDSYVNEWFSYEPHQASVLQSLSLIRESEDGSPYRYMTSPKDRGYHSLVSSNMLAYWVDTRMIPVNKDDWTIGWNIHQENTDQPYSKEDWVMFLESYYLSETGVTSRFEKKKSLVYFNQ